MHLKSLGYEELIERGVSEGFARILSDPVDYAPDLRFHVSKTDCDYYIPEDAIDVVPLWDQNADTYARWTRNGVIEYVLLFHDDPEWSLIATSEQGIMAELWNSWAEHQEDDEENFRFANAIGFKHCEKALKIWGDDYDKFQQWKLNLR